MIPDINSITLLTIIIIKFVAMLLIKLFQINYLIHVILLKINYIFVTLTTEQNKYITVNCIMLKMLLMMLLLYRIKAQTN